MGGIKIEYILRGEKDHHEACPKAPAPAMLCVRWKERPPKPGRETFFFFSSVNRIRKNLVRDERCR